MSATIIGGAQSIKVKKNPADEFSEQLSKVFSHHISGHQTKIIIAAFIFLQD